MKAYLGAPSEVYVRLLTTLCLNIPFLILALARHLNEVAWVGLPGLYVILVFLGYYVSFLIVLLTGLFILAGRSARFFVTGGMTVLTTALLYLAVNSVVYGVFRLHIDSFWVEYLVTSFTRVGLTRGLVATAVALVVGVVILEAGLFHVASRVPGRQWLVSAVVATCLLSFPASQLVHILANERNDSRVTGFTPQLPFYYPVRSHNNAVKHSGLLPVIAEAEGPVVGDAAASFQYPRTNVPCVVPAGGRRPNILMVVLESWRFDMMDAVVSPNIDTFSRRSAVFLNHLSSGNSTPHGIFSLFYGLHPTYWEVVKANNAVIHNPVLIDALEANGYAFGIFANSQFKRHKIKDAMFRGIPVHESLAGATPDAQDADLTTQLLAFMEGRSREGTPFFGFAFYKSTHFSYHYPLASKRFEPAQDLNLAVARASLNPSPFLNDYRNAVGYVDSLVGRLLERMEELGMLEETIVIITSDHGEEFNDNRSNYWGHTGNFTQYQTQVPMILYVPWRKPQRVAKVTAHIDIPATLLQEGLGCGGETDDYSNGQNLFGPLNRERPLVIASYVNYAVVFGDNVYVVNPAHLQRYKRSDIRAEAGPIPPELSRQAIEGMTRFMRASQ